MTDVTKPLMRYHGAKFRIADWVISNFPEHKCYVEPFGGAAGVLLRKPRAYAEVYNDLDRDVVNLFEVLRDPAKCKDFIRDISLTPYSRDEFDRAWIREEGISAIEKARRLVIRAQMGFGSGGATKGATGFRIDTKRDYGTAQQLWAEYPESVSIAAKRLTGVLVENRPAIDVMKAHDGPETLHYVDPPYMHDTRVGTNSSGGRIYRHELDDDEHDQLLKELLQLEGMVIVSGYRSPLYEELLKDWDSRSISARISAGRGTALREEVIWLNPKCANKTSQMKLFDGSAA